MNFISSGVFSIEEATPIIKANIDNELGSEYSTLRDVVIMHNRMVSKKKLGPEMPAVLYIRDYNLKITYSRQKGSALDVGVVSEKHVKDTWFCVSVNEKVELKNKYVELRFNGKSLELVATRQCKSISKNLELVETMEEFAWFQFDLINKKTNYVGEMFGWKGLKNAGLGSFTVLLKEKGCVFTQGHRECLEVVQQAIRQSPEFAMAAKECNLEKVARFGLSNLIMVLYQYICNDSLKHLLDSQIGFYLVERFNRELHDQVEKMEQIFHQVFRHGDNLFEILGIEDADKERFNQLLDSESRFYSEWELYTKKESKPRRLSYFGY